MMVEIPLGYQECSDASLMMRVHPNYLAIMSLIVRTLIL